MDTELASLECVLNIEVCSHISLQRHARDSGAQRCWVISPISDLVGLCSCRPRSSVCCKARILQRPKTETQRATHCCYATIGPHLGTHAQAPGASPSTSDDSAIRQYQAFTELFDSLPNTVLDETLPVPASTLWQAMFGSDAFMAKFYDRQQYTALVMQPWEYNSACASGCQDPSFHRHV